MAFVKGVSVTTILCVFGFTRTFLFLPWWGLNAYFFYERQIMRRERMETGYNKKERISPYLSLNTGPVHIYRTAHLATS